MDIVPQGGVFKVPEKARIKVDQHGLLFPHVNSRARLLDRSVSSICC